MSQGPSEKTVRFAPPGSGSGFKLVCVGPTGVRGFPLPPEGSVVLGRDPSADICIASDAVSRQHARFRVQQGVATVEDLGSTNGTWIGGQRLHSATELAPGVIVQLGDHSAYLSTQTAERSDASSLRAVAPHVPDLPNDAATRKVYELARRFAKGDLPLLILGETGAGKEVLASFVHQNSARAAKPYLQVNCAALPENLIEAELFGYQKGAFTGANETKPGLFELASGGTMLLDEIGDLPLLQQVKLLRVLEQGVLRRLGSTEDRKVDVRILAATNATLEAAMTAGRFRTDLFHRLSGAKLLLPPLRERKADLIPLATHFLLAAAGSRKLSLGEDAKTLIASYAWPGNVRELKNVMQRAPLLCDGNVIKGEHLPDELHVAASVGASAVPAKGELTERSPVGDELKELERERIVQALAACEGNQTRAAAYLGMPRRTLVHRIAQYGLARGKKG